MIVISLDQLAFHNDYEIHDKSSTASTLKKVLLILSFLYYVCLFSSVSTLTFPKGTEYCKHAATTLALDGCFQNMMTAGIKLVYFFRKSC